MLAPPLDNTLPDSPPTSTTTTLAADITTTTANTRSPTPPPPVPHCCAAKGCTSTLTYRMTMAEEKQDSLLKEMKALQLSHAKVATVVGDLATWTTAAEKISEDMKAKVEALTSRIKVLEFKSTEQPKAPPCEEEGRAKSHNNPF
jgi:hypothetical protein